MLGSKKIKKKKKRSFCNITKKRKNTSTKAIDLPSTSETAGENESDDVPAVCPAAVKGKRKREKTQKHTNNYLKFGSIFKETDGIEFPMCVICSTVLSNKSMKPSKLQRHLETTHSQTNKQKRKRLLDTSKYFPCFHQWMSCEILLCSCLPLTHAILAHLEELHGQFRNYFSEANSWRRDKTWIQFSFRDNPPDGDREASAH